MLFAIALAFFLLLPIAVIIPASLTAGAFLSVTPEGLSTRWYDEVFTNPIWRDAFFLSAQIAVAAALIATVLGTAAALALSRVTRGARWLRSFLIMPLVLPYVVYALGLFNLTDSLRLTPGSAMIIVGQTCLAFPIVFVAVSAGIGRLDPALTRAASSLGARWPMVVWRIEIPLLRWNIIAAAIFAFAFCFDELVIALFLASPGSSTLPVQIFTSARDSVSPAIAAAGTVVMFVAMCALVAVTLVMKTQSNRARRSSVPTP